MLLRNYILIDYANSTRDGFLEAAQEWQDLADYYSHSGNAGTVGGFGAAGGAAGRNGRVANNVRGTGGIIGAVSAIALVPHHYAAASFVSLYRRQASEVEIPELDTDMVESEDFNSNFDQFILRQDINSIKVDMGKCWSRE